MSSTLESFCGLLRVFQEMCLFVAIVCWMCQSVVVLPQISVSNSISVASQHRPVLLAVLWTSLGSLAVCLVGLVALVENHRPLMLAFAALEVTWTAVGFRVFVGFEKLFFAHILFAALAVVYLALFSLKSLAK